MYLRFLLFIFLIFPCTIMYSFQESSLKKASISSEVVRECTDFTSITTDSGVLYNNVWNKKAAKNQSWKQCIERQINDSISKIGWTWEWPTISKAPIIYAYPQIKIGRSPWDPMPCNDDRFPLSITNLKTLDISYEMVTKTDGQHNLAATMWIVDSDKKIEKRDPNAIKGELMIWTYTTSKHLNPAGSKYSEILVDDLKWEVWTQKNWSDPSGQNANKWNNITFKLKQNQLKISYNALELVRYAVKERIIPEYSFIADVELGNEIRSGAGQTLIKSFNVSFLEKSKR